jgi:hypothetical protein
MMTPWSLCSSSGLDEIVYPNSPENPLVEKSWFSGPCPAQTSNRLTDYVGTLPLVVSGT